MTLYTDLPYRPQSERGWLDIMLPDGEGPFPVVVCIHGGGWQGGDKEGMHWYGEILVEMGIAAVLPNYRLAPAHPHPAQEEDILAALEWIATHAEEYALDPTRVGLTGVSAGGHLTALVGLKATRRDAAPCRVRCILPVCAPTDIAQFAHDKPELLPVIEALIGGPLDEKMGVARDASPVAHVHPGAPPCLATHGEADQIVPCDQSVRLVEALRAVGVKAEAIIVPGVDHAAHMPDTDPLEPLGGAEAFRAFFRRHLLER